MDNYKIHLIKWLENKDIHTDHYKLFILKYQGNDSTKLIENIKFNIFLLSNISYIMNSKNKSNEYKIDKIYLYVSDLINTNFNILKSVDWKFRDPPFNPVMKPGIKFEIIFIRHGVSCANVIHNDFGKSIRNNSDIEKVFDPELTKTGVERAKRVSTKFIQKVNDLFGSENYMICASWLMRTHQTAYYMIAKDTGKKINIIPHIAEHGMGAGDIARSKERQIEILTGKGSQIVNCYGQDWRNEQTIFNKDDKRYFFNWINNNLDKINESRGTDGVYRLLIFTHGVWIKETINFENPRIMWWPQNNHTFHTVIDDQYDINKRIEYDINNENLVNTYRHENFEESTDELFECPDECRVSFCPK